MSALAELLTPVHRALVTAEAYLGGSKLADLLVSGGSVTADSRRAQMREAAVSFAPGFGLTLADVADLLLTPGLEIALARGIETQSETIMAPVGRFMVRRTDDKLSTDAVSAQLADLSWRVARARWIEPYQIAAGTNLAEALNDLLANRFPSVVSSLTQTMLPQALVTQAIWEAGPDSDPWADAKSLAEAYGYALYFDGSGVVTARRESDLLARSPVYTFVHGAAAIVTDVTRTADLDATYNVVVASGEGPDVETPVQGIARDDDPASRTYWRGPMGEVPRWYASPFITTVDQAEDAAQAILARSLGRAETLEWSHVPHPGLQPLDVVGVVLVDALTHVFILDRLTTPLDVNTAMQAVAREVRVAS